MSSTPSAVEELFARAYAQALRSRIELLIAEFKYNIALPLHVRTCVKPCVGGVCECAHAWA